MCNVDLCLSELSKEVSINCYDGDDGYWVSIMLAVSISFHIRISQEVVDGNTALVSKFQSSLST